MPGSIELLVYSGRPNPRVELDPSTEAELARRLAALGPLDHAFAADERLGYTGLRIVGLPTSEIREVDLSAGGVRVHERSGQTRELSDKDHALERWLLGILGTRMTGDDRILVEQILDQLGK